MHFILTAIYFETGAMAAPTKSQNSTVLGQGVLASTQWSHPIEGFAIGALLKSDHIIGY